MASYQANKVIFFILVFSSIKFNIGLLILILKALFNVNFKITLVMIKKYTTFN